MRRNRGTNVFSLIGKSIFDANMGRIRWRPNMWALIGSPWDKRRIARPDLANRGNINEMGHFVIDDHVLVHKPFTLCPSAPVPQDQFWHDEKGWRVPAVVCRKCEYHQASNRTVRFPRCKFKASDASKAAADSLVQIGQMVGKAIKETEEILRGSA